MIYDGTNAPTKNYWYPQADSQTYTLAEISAPDFAATYPKGVTDPLMVEETTDMMKKHAFAKFSVFLDDSLAQHVYDHFYPQGADDGESYIQLHTMYMHYCLWAIKMGAEQKLGTFNFTAAKHEYYATIRPLLARLDVLQPGGTSYVSHLDPIFAADNDTDSLIPSLGAVPSFHLTQLNTKQLARLDPAASEEKDTQILKKPVSTYIQNVNGKVQADGAIFTGLFQPLTVVLSPEPSVAHATSHPVTVHYVDEQGNTLKPDKTLTGSLDDNYKTEPLSITGYKLVKTTGDESGKFTSSDQSVTYTYRKAPADVVVKNSVVYATKKISLYSSPTFTKKAIKQTYAKKSRMNRPMFKVIGTATSKNGVKRYKVKDLNGKGTTGYITANSDYVAPLYYAKNQSKITVINPKGLNAYSRKNLTGKVAHYKQGKVLKVTQIVHHNLTTRFVLSNGKYVSANKKLVITGKYKMPKRVQAKTAINRYGTANLTKRNRHYAKKTHATFNVTGWAYSNANNFRKGDTLRYKVAGGYITANNHLVKALK
ncbi:hypothetical protein FD13_GL001258 [Levilactobacillus senmaizukei DSM 21775 = NBRC 103853]|uniref:MucBP domain-containing protein n=2 Tax=Levilactobacillus senmaizukei TaxID=431273 RepID=A0A0R2DG21_9LACO|nr:hypothetical protein FD13_GL001258 [Levilactobacillus senmaizukei DSM 21775 = NBRC 103853]